MRVRNVPRYWSRGATKSLGRGPCTSAKTYTGFHGTNRRPVDWRRARWLFSNANPRRRAARRERLLAATEKEPASINADKGFQAARRSTDGSHLPPTQHPPTPTPPLRIVSIHSKCG